MNEQLYRAVMREVSDPMLLAMITRNVLESAAHRAVESEIALRKIKETLS